MSTRYQCPACAVVLTLTAKPPPRFKCPKCAREVTLVAAPSVTTPPKRATNGAAIAPPPHPVPQARSRGRRFAPLVVGLVVFAAGVVVGNVYPIRDVFQTPDRDVARAPSDPAPAPPAPAVPAPSPTLPADPTGPKPAPAPVLPADPKPVPTPPVAPADPGTPPPWPDAKGVKAAAVVPLAKPDTPLKVLHVLLVADTNAKTYELDGSVSPTNVISEAAALDAQAFTQLLQKGLKGSDVRVTLMAGGGVTRKKILDHFADLPPGPDAGFLCFYCGHGAMDKTTKRHALTLDSGNVFRDEVVAAMTARKPRFAALVTSCCSSYASFTQPVVTAPTAKDAAAGFGPDPGEYPEEVRQNLRDLFLRHAGVLDITAAEPGTYGWARADGTVFTNAFLDTLRQPRVAADPNKDGFVTWAELWPMVVVNTNGRYRTAPSPVQANQIPYAFRIPMLEEPELRPPVSAPDGTALVAMTNHTDRELTCELRWGATGKPVQFVLAPGALNYYSYGVDEYGTAPPPLLTYEALPGKSRTVELRYNVADGVIRAEYARPHSFLKNKKTGEVRLFAAD